MVITVNRDGVCMGDDSFDHRIEVTLEDGATGRDLLEKLISMDYLPRQQGAVWYTWSLATPCIIAYSCNRQKIVAEVKDVPLTKLADCRLSLDFRHLCFKEDMHIVADAIRKTPGIWYDRDFLASCR